MGSSQEPEQFYGFAFTEGEPDRGTPGPWLYTPNIITTLTLMVFTGHVLKVLDNKIPFWYAVGVESYGLEELLILWGSIGSRREMVSTTGDLKVTEVTCQTGDGSDRCL